MTAETLLKTLLLSKTDSPSLETMAVGLGAAALGGIGVGWLHARSATRDDPAARELALALVMVAVLAAMVTMTIGRSLGVAVGLMGATRAISFRTSIAGPVQAALVLWAAVTGIACGGGHLLVAAATIVGGAACLAGARALPLERGRMVTSLVRIDTAGEPDGVVRAMRAGALEHRLEQSWLLDTGRRRVLCYRIWSSRPADLDALVSAVHARPEVASVALVPAWPAHPG